MMQPDWRLEVERALLTITNAKRSRDRAEAAQHLVQLALDDPRRGEELAAHVPRLLDDADPSLRRVGVALAAASLPPDEAEPVLAARLTDKASEVRMEAIGQLADAARPNVRGLFAAALEDPDFRVRFEAARGMATLRHSAGIDVLIEGLDRDHLRFRALGALAELGDVQALPAVRRILDRWLLPGFERTQAAGALAKLGDPAGAEWLMGRTRRRWGIDRALAIELLGEVKAPGARERLLEILADKKDKCRGAAARGLGRLGDPESVGPLSALLQSSTLSADLRLDAAEGLCLLGGPDARSNVERVCSADEDPTIREELRALLEEYA